MDRRWTRCESPRTLIVNTAMFHEHGSPTRSFRFHRSGDLGHRRHGPPPRRNWSRCSEATEMRRLAAVPCWDEGRTRSGAVAHRSVFVPYPPVGRMLTSSDGKALKPGSRPRASAARGRRGRDPADVAATPPNVWDPTSSMCPSCYSTAVGNGPATTRTALSCASPSASWPAGASTTVCRSGPLARRSLRRGLVGAGRDSWPMCAPGSSSSTANASSSGWSSVVARC
jgi:hypothetical protein